MGIGSSFRFVARPSWLQAAIVIKTAFAMTASQRLGSSRLVAQAARLGDGGAHAHRSLYSMNGCATEAIGDFGLGNAAPADRWFPPCGDHPPSYGLGESGACRALDGVRHQDGACARTRGRLQALVSGLAHKTDDDLCGLPRG